MLKNLTYRVAAVALAVPVLAAGVWPAAEHICEMHGSTTQSGVPCTCPHESTRHSEPEHDVPPCHGTAPSAPDSKHDGDRCCTIEAASPVPDAVSERPATTQRVDVALAWQPALSEMPAAPEVDVPQIRASLLDSSPPDIPILFGSLLL